MERLPIDRRQLLEVTSAVALVNNVIYKPGWKFEAEDHTSRFEGSVKVKINYPARKSERKDAEIGYPTEIATYASFIMVVADCDDTMIYRQLIDRVLQIEEHEAREFLRVMPTFWAPFHPHRVDGMKRWGKMEADLGFGVA